MLHTHNKLIAQFMWKHSTILDVSDTKYHTSWDWLMPVVEKIYQLDKDVDFFGSINFEATYKEVVHFIQEHNLNK